RTDTAGLIHNLHLHDGNAGRARVILLLHQNLPAARFHQYVQGDCAGLELRRHLRGAARFIAQHHLVAGSGKMRLDELSRHRVILNDKNPRWFFCLSRELAFLRPALWNSRSNRQTEMKATSLAWLALEPELAAMQFDQA